MPGEIRRPAPGGSRRQACVCLVASGAVATAWGTNAGVRAGAAPDNKHTTVVSRGWVACVVRPRRIHHREDPPSTPVKGLPAEPSAASERRNFAFDHSGASGLTTRYSRVETLHLRAQSGDALSGPPRRQSPFCQSSGEAAQAACLKIPSSSVHSSRQHHLIPFQLIHQPRSRCRGESGGC